jgi:TolA-binding protein
MPTDPLENLLRQADAASPSPPASHHDLASGARVAWTRNRRYRRITGSLAAAAICAIAISVFISHQPARQVASVIQPATARPSSIVDRKDLESQQANEEQLIQAMLSIESLNEAQQRLDHLPKVDLLQRLQDEREESATAVLQNATTAHGNSEAVAIYHEVAENYPGTGAAAVADKALKDIH